MQIPLRSIEPPPSSASPLSFPTHPIYSAPPVHSTSVGLRSGKQGASGEPLGAGEPWELGNLDALLVSPFVSPFVSPLVSLLLSLLVGHFVSLLLKPLQSLTPLSALLLLGSARAYRGGFCFLLFFTGLGRSKIPPAKCALRPRRFHSGKRAGSLLHCQACLLWPARQQPILLLSLVMLDSPPCT